MLTIGAGAETGATIEIGGVVVDIAGELSASLIKGQAIIGVFEVDPNAVGIAYGGFAAHDRIDGGVETLTAAYDYGFGSVPGGSSFDETVEGASTLYVSSGAVANLTTLAGDLGDDAGFQATMAVFAGGLASGTTVSDRGNLQVQGSALYSDIFSGGVETLLSGGLETSGTVQSGGTLVLSSGAALDGPQILRGGLVSGLGLLSGLIGDYGAVVSAAVASGGELVVLSGGLASAVSVLSGGMLDLSLGGRVVGGVVSSGATAEVQIQVGSGRTDVLAPAATSGSMTLSGITVQAGGALDYVSAIVGRGGVLSLSEGAVLSGATVSFGGELLGLGALAGYDGQNVWDYGLVSGVSLADDTDLVAQARGVISSVSAGGENDSIGVAYGGVADALTVTGEDATVYVDAGGLLSGLTASAHDQAIAQSVEVYGHASAVVLANSAEEDVFSGGVAVATQVGEGSVMAIVTGGVASATLVGAGGALDVDGGSVVGATVMAGGQISGSGDLVSGVIVASSGASVVSVGLASGASEVLYGGATDSAVSVGSGATLALADIMVSGALTVGRLTASQAISGAQVASGALVTLQGAEVTSGGFLRVGSGGVTSGVALDGDAAALVVPGGGVSNVAVSSGAVLSCLGVVSGALTIASGGFVSATRLPAASTITDSGTLAYMGATRQLLCGMLAGGGVVADSGTGVLVLDEAGSGLTGSVVVGGGTVEIATATGAGQASIAFAPSRTASSATLQLDAPARPANGAIFANVLSNFADPKDALDLSGVRFVSGATASLSGTTLTLKDGAYSAGFNLAGAVAAGYIVSADSSGGTEILASVVTADAVRQAAATFGTGSGIFSITGTDHSVENGSRNASFIYVSGRTCCTPA